MNTTLHQNRPEDTQNWTNLYLEPHDYRIHYVNIDLCHQNGISVAESQTFLLAKRPQRRLKSEEKRMSSQARASSPERKKFLVPRNMSANKIRDDIMTLIRPLQCYLNKSFMSNFHL